MRSLLLLLLAMAPLARAGCLVPIWKQTPLTGRAATSLATADFDGNGRPDVAGLTADAAFVLLNDGTGKLGGAVDVHGGALRGTIVAAELTGDARADLAFAREGALIVLPGRGDGTFGAAIESAIGIAPSRIVAAQSELIALDPAAAKLVTYRNDGAGRFTELQSTAVRASATAIAAGDVDGDNQRDLLVAYTDFNTIDVFYGTGGGRTGAAAAVQAFASHAVGIEIADVNGNGRTDIVVAREHAAVSVVRNLGNRTFGDPLTYNFIFSRPVNDLAVADLNGDGAPDFAVSGACAVQTVSDTGRPPRAWFSEDDDCFSDYERIDGAIVTADFDGDGRRDLAASFPRQARDPGVIAFRNLCGDAALTAAAATPTVSTGQSATIAVQVAPPVIQRFIVPATGTVTIRQGQQVLGSAALQPNQPLTPIEIATGALPPGEHTLTVDYEGDAQHGPQQTTVTLRVTAAVTETAITVDPATPVYGQPPAITVRVTSSAGGTPAGEVSITVDDSPVFFGDTTAPEATVGGASTVGTHRVVALYRGDATHPPSAASLTYEVVRQTPTVVLEPAFGVESQPLDNFRVDVNENGQGLGPSGSVTLRLDGTTIETRPLGFSSSASFALPALAAGRHTLRITYTGDGNYTPVDRIVPFVVFPATSLSIDARGTDEGILVSWNAPNHLTIRRRTAAQSWAEGTGFCCPGAPELHTDPEPEVVYLYRMENHNATSFSNVDVAMRYGFTDDPLLPEQRVSPVHMAEVVRAADVLRAAAGLSAIALPAVPPSAERRRSAQAGSGIPASHVELLRAAINEARVKLGAYAFAFTASLSASANASHVQELREAIR